MCGLIACTNETLSSCGQRFPSTVTVDEQRVVFNSIIVSGIFNTAEGELVSSGFIPNSLDSSILPFHPNEFNYIDQHIVIGNSTKKSITFTLTTPKSNLMSFVIYGRNFNKDGSSATLFPLSPPPRPHPQPNTEVPTIKTTTPKSTVTVTGSGSGNSYSKGFILFNICVIVVMLLN